MNVGRAVRCFVLTTVLVCLLQGALLAADGGRTPTFYRDVLPIVQDNCQTCHRPFGVNMGGMVAPMSFMDYGEVRPWAKAIARVVSAREMPPWDARPEFNGVFRNERILSEEQIQTLVTWATSGAVAGDAADAPPPIAWSDTEWRLGEPDLVVYMPEAFFVDDDVDDLYMNFPVVITEEMMPEPRFIRASEARGSSTAVHHIIARPLGFLAPGGGHKEYPEGYGKLIGPGTEVNFDMHYHKEAGPGTGVWDRSMVALWFHPVDKPVYHQVSTGVVGNWEFEIPPGADNWRVGSSLFFAEDSIILSLVPHMHLRGTFAEFSAHYPDGTSELLMQVDYDFYWQAGYEFREPRKMPAGTRVDFTAYYDNSATNPYNPDPTVAVRFGDPTTSEMSLIFVNWSLAAPRYFNQRPASTTGAGQ